MLLQFFFWHICRVMIVQIVVYAGHVLYIIENLGYVVTYDDDGAFLVDLFQHLEFRRVLFRSRTSAFEICGRCRCSAHRE